MFDSTASNWIDLTSRQRSIWLDVSASGDNRLFQVGVLAKIQQELDLQLLQQALDDVALRHDGLRLVIDPHQPRQRIDQNLRIPISVLDFSFEADPGAAVQAHIDQLFADPLPLSDRLIQLIAVRYDRHRYFLILRGHHIVTDAIGFSLTFKDIIATYDTLTSKVPVQRSYSSYRRFQEQDAAYSASPRLKRDLEYWQIRLRSLPESLFAKRLSVDNAAARPLVRRQIDFSRFKHFLSHCAANDIGPASAIYALGAWLLASARKRHELVLGVAYPGRTKEHRHTLGMFSGVMPLRVKLPSSTSLPQLARLIAQSTARDYLHHRASIDDISRNVGADQRHRLRLVDLMVSYIPPEVCDLEVMLGAEQLKATPLRGTEANPLALYVSGPDGSQLVTADFAYDRRYLSDNQASHLAVQFVRLLDAFLENPDAQMLPAESLANESFEHDSADNNPRSPGSAPDHQVRIVSTFTSLPIENSLQFWLRRTGIEASLEFAGYNQLFQELLDPASAMRRNRRGANVVLLRMEDWLRERPADISMSEGANFLKKVTDDLIAALRDATSKSHVPCLLLICPPSPQWDAGGPWNSVQNHLLDKLAAGVGGVGGLDVATYQDLRTLYPVDAEYDGTSDKLGHIPYTTAGFAAIGTYAARRIHLRLRSPVKVIAVDCDNTLWDGVAGEDGPLGVRILPRHRRLQERLVEAARCGVLICLCSKNIEDDVASVFHQRSDMALRHEHIVSRKVNWQPKSENIKELARELSLGLDSFLFLDDNPVEVAEVSATCPQVQCLLIDGSPSQESYIDHLWPLDCLAATEEDAKRVESYRTNVSRNQERARSTDFASFIKALDLRLEIECPNNTNLSRLAQLTERTNQFNINNLKRTAISLDEQNAAADAAVLAFKVSDKFGDYGIVGLLAAHLQGGEFIVDNFLMSCRVLGRGVEHRMISEIGRIAVEYGATDIRIPVRVTDRNLPVRSFLESIGGQRLTDGDSLLHIIPAKTASELIFSPESHVESDADEAEAAAPTGLVGRVNGTIWMEAAAVSASVALIEGAVLAANGERRSIEITREAQTRTEKILEEMFCAALALKAVGADDDFFDLGVHSLMAVQLVSRIRDRFRYQLSIRTLFECSTIAKLAKAIDEQISSGYQPLVPLQMGDEQPALFCCHPANGDAVCYMRLTKAIGPDQTVYGFEASGLSAGEPMAKSLQEMAQIYIREMVSVQPKGPYHLLGWSFGGTLAFEIARQIHEAGGQVGFLGMMDAVAPNEGPLPKKMDDLDQIDDATFLEAVGKELNNHRRYAKLPLLDIRSLTWKQVIDGFQSLGIVPHDYSFEEMRRKMRVYANCGILTKPYRPPALPVPIVHFQASQNLREWDFDWTPYSTSGVSTIWVKCNHYRMGFEPNTTLIGAHLRAFIRGDRTVLGWWQRTILGSRVSGVIGRLALKRA